MGTYASQQDLVDRFGQDELIRLTNPDDLQATTIDTARLDRAIADAEASVDGYLAGPYDTPLDPVPRVVTKITCDLARFELYDEHAPEQITARKEDALKFLRSVARGDVTLGSSASGEQVERDDQANIESGGRVFGRDGGGFL